MHTLCAKYGCGRRGKGGKLLPADFDHHRHHHSLQHLQQGIWSLSQENSTAHTEFVVGKSIAKERFIKNNNSLNSFNQQHTFLEFNFRKILLI